MDSLLANLVHKHVPSPDSLLANLVHDHAYPIAILLANQVYKRMCGNLWGWESLSWLVANLVYKRTSPHHLLVNQVHKHVPPPDPCS